jgi:hypothetical protein
MPVPNMGHIIQYILLDYDIVYSDRCLPTFWRNILPPSKGYKYLENGVSMFLRTVGTHLLYYAVS